ncbi:MAG: 30S ribosomal protein S3 [Candidatus Aenigmarchaeota archaeon]|nr:30S ribosomal protein S3 [Candidatus Aenigmarchaeota archaeon]
MAVEKYFINEVIKEAKIEEFMKEKFDRAGYSHTIIQRTPLGTRIIVFVSRPGLVIGRSGKKIKEITEEIKEKFELENPMLDVKDVENQFLDAQLVADRIVKALERGIFYKRIANKYLESIMDAGAVGVEIKISGKLGGERGRMQKFKDGYIKHAGYYADNLVDKGFAVANLKQGIVGVQVRILKSVPEDLSLKLKKVETDEDKGHKETN